MTFDESTEVWREIPGLTGYEVSDLGRVRSYRAHGGRRRLTTPYLKTTRTNGHGYLSVVLQVEPGRSQAFCVHSLVASAFLGPKPDGCQVAHADGDKTNSRLSNLRYATPAENASDKVAHGTDPLGERNGRHKLTESQVREIIVRWRAGWTQKSLAAAYGVRQQSISNIVRGIRWSHLGESA